ncbi:hypothetical protein AMTRI_Chr07g28710 [Amborella trichopoda]
MSSDNVGSNYQWTVLQNESLLEIKADYARKGMRANGQFVRDAWAIIICHMCQQYGPGLISKYGFGWNEDRRMISTSWDVWEEYIGRHQWALKYQSKSFPPMNNMDLVFGDGIAQGNRRQSVLDEEETGEEEPWEAEEFASIGRNTRSVSISKRKRNGKTISIAHELAVVVGSLSSSMDWILAHSVLFQIRCMEVVADVYKDEGMDLLFYIKAVDLFADPMKARIFLSIDLQYCKMWLRTHVPQD